MLLLVASVTMPGPALMRGARLFWCCAAAHLRAAWRAVLSAGRGAWWAGLLRGIGRCLVGASMSAAGGVVVAGDQGRW